MPIQYPRKNFIKDLNLILEQQANFGSNVYDFGGDNYIVPAPAGAIRINGEDRHDVYIIAFNKDETNARTDTNTRS